MDKKRLETFGDAIIAIVLTILVLKLPKPETLTIIGFWTLRLNFISYLISFLIIFNVWYNTHNFFQLVTEVNDLVVWLNGFTLFMLSLLPFFTSFVSLHVYSLTAEILYGLVLILIHLFYILTVKAQLEFDKENIKLKNADFLNKRVNTPVLIIFAGFIVSFYIYPPGILISCLLAVLVWIINFRPYKDVIDK